MSQKKLAKSKICIAAAASTTLWRSMRPKLNKEIVWSNNTPWRVKRVYKRMQSFQESVVEATAGMIELCDNYVTNRNSIKLIQNTKLLQKISCQWLWSQQSCLNLQISQWIIRGNKLKIGGIKISTSMIHRA